MNKTGRLISIKIPLFEQNMIGEVCVACPRMRSPTRPAARNGLHGAYSRRGRTSYEPSGAPACSGRKRWTDHRANAASVLSSDFVDAVDEAPRLVPMLLVATLRPALAKPDQVRLALHQIPVVRSSLTSRTARECRNSERPPCGGLLVGSALG